MSKLRVKRVNPNAKLPEVAHIGEDFGYDVFACLQGQYDPKTEEVYTITVTINPGEQKIIPTGIAVHMEMLWAGHGYQVGLIAKQSSGLALKRALDVKAGVIDAGYRNEIKILLYNYGNEPQVIRHHDKIGQLVPMPVIGGLVEEVEELSGSKRGLAGWGSGQTDANRES